MRASSSIALNLAESTGKITQKDKIKYFSIAFGSLRESQAILEIEEIENPKLIEITDQLGGMLYKLCKVSERGKSTSDSEHHTEAPIIEHRSSIIDQSSEIRTANRVRIPRLRGVEAITWH
jgi:hypothetical protein